MISFEHQLRVRYADTDQMSYVYYGKYAEYLETARTEMIRSWGITYKDMEESGVMMPVIEFNMKFRKPGRYDDLLTIRCEVKEMPQMKLKVWNEVRNESGDLLAEGEVVLAFIDRENMRPIPAGGRFLELLSNVMNGVPKS